MRHMHSIISLFRDWWDTLGGKKRVNYVADFETTTTAEDCRVWAYGLADIDKATTLWDVEIGTSIERFCNRMMEENSVCPSGAYSSPTNLPPRRAIVGLAILLQVRG